MKSLNSYALPANAARRLLEIANGVETSEGGRIYVEQVNIAILREDGWPDEYRAGIDKLRADGLIDMHDSGAFFRFADKGARRFASFTAVSQRPGAGGRFQHPRRLGSRC
jgi:hypothetical protein